MKNFQFFLILISEFQVRSVDELTMRVRHVRSAGSKKTRLKGNSERNMVMNHGKLCAAFFWTGTFLLVAFIVHFFSHDTKAAGPLFAPPCSAAGTCRELDPCADKDFGQCKGFKGVSGLRREVSGTLGSLGFLARIVDAKSGKPVSLWHDVPLLVSDDEKGMVVNAFFEVSRGTQAKIELNKWAPHNPLWQDREEVRGQNFERPRYYGWSPAPGNYGALPRTWENVLEEDFMTGFPGDTDPIDVVDVGTAASPAGMVCRVKVIGALGMIDGTDLQTDWKIFVINIKDKKAPQINDISDVPKELLEQWGLFWRFYKTAKGLSENFFYDPESRKKLNVDPVWLGAKEARKIVLASKAAYDKLLKECLNLKVDKPYWVPGCSN